MTTDEAINGFPDSPACQWEFENFYWTDDCSEDFFFRVVTQAYFGSGFEAGERSGFEAGKQHVWNLISPLPMKRRPSHAS